MKTCTKCSGSGKYQGYGICFRCNGSGHFATKTKNGPRYSIGDKIRHNLTGNIYEITEVRNRYYKTRKYAPDGITLLSTLDQPGRHIDNYPDESNMGYTKIQ